MVDRDNYRMLSDEEKSQYKFEFCVGCVLYDECEMVEQYARFSDNHHKIHKSHISQIPSGVRKSTEVFFKGREIGQIVINGGTDSIGGFGIDRLSYDQEELKDGCFMSRRYVYAIKCGEQRVTEGIGDHYKIETQYDAEIRTGANDRWEPSQPVFISAQTGKGKNYFIEHTLIPYVRELNYKNKTNQRILILSNRLALKQQVKNRLAGNDDPDEDGVEVYSYGEFADVMTYQSLLNQKARLKHKQTAASSRYIYVICDEAHFFTSDAMFNPHTNKILEAIVRLFSNAIRVYMSATPYECLKFIVDWEDKYQYRMASCDQLKSKYIPMVLYHFKRDYNYLDVKEYSEITELNELIANSVVKKKEKWLIFIDDTAKCESVKNKLEQYKYPEKDDSYAEESAEQHPLKGKILAVSADSKSDEAYMSMVKNEKLSNEIYVLITTSVLDNGVNLSGIKNIVISDMSKVKCLQMAGRARVSDPADRKTLYIKRFRISEVNAKINALERQKDAYHSYDMTYGEGRGADKNGKYHFFNKFYNGKSEDWLNAEHWFGRRRDDECDIANPELYINEIAKSLLDRRIQQYKSILEEMTDEASALNETQVQGGATHTGQLYLEHQLSWFGKMYRVDDDVTFADKDKEKKALITFLESYADSKSEIADQADRIKFQADFTKLYEAAFGPISKNKRENKGTGGLQMNRALADKEIGYKIVGKLEQGPWTIIKTDEGQESPE